MRRGIESGHCVGRQQESEQEGIEKAPALWPHAAAGIAGVVGEGEEATDVDAGGVGQHADGQDNGRDDDEITAEIRENRRCPDADVVEQPLGAQDDCDGNRLDPIGTGRNLLGERFGQIRDEVSRIPAQIVLTDQGHEEKLP